MSNQSIVLLSSQHGDVALASVPVSLASADGQLPYAANKVRAALQIETRSGGSVLPKFSKPSVIAAQLGLCNRTLHRWADRGLITRYKINARVVLFNEAEVLELVRSAKV